MDSGHQSGQVCNVDVYELQRDRNGSPKIQATMLYRSVSAFCCRVTVDTEGFDAASAVVSQRVGGTWRAADRSGTQERCDASQHGRGRWRWRDAAIRCGGTLS